jgi:hypothetical protein
MQLRKISVAAKKQTKSDFFPGGVQQLITSTDVR